MKPPPNKYGIKAAPHVLDKRGHVKKHKFEEPHDEPSGIGPCWDCLLPRESPVHDVRRSRDR